MCGNPNLLKFDARPSLRISPPERSGSPRAMPSQSTQKWTQNRRWGEVDFSIPKEGGPSYIDSMVHTQGFQKQQDRLSFIDFI
jgi:hypothetical protein